LTTRPRSFTAHVKADGVPAAKELSVPLSRVFPLFGGNFRFAKVDGAVSADVDATGNLGDWKSSLTGEARTTFSNVHFSREGDFGQLAALLRLEGLGSKVRTIDVDSSIGDGRVAIRQVLVDGDPARLPVKGSVGFDGAVDVRVELSKAKLGKRLEPYRPIVGLFEPEFTGAVKSPTFGVRVPTAQKLAQESAKLAARSVLGGEKLDLAKLAGARSLGDFAALDDDETLDTRPDLDGSGAGKPAVTDANAAVPKSDGTGSLPAELNAPFRALTRGKTRFDYAALGRDKALTERLRAWLEAAPVAPRSDDASLADALNRYEVALALAVAKELENPLFRITSGKRGVHGIDGFFDRPVAVSGLTTTLAELALRIRTMGGVAAAGCIPGAAEDLPWIDRAGVDASTVRRSMDERAAAYVAASKWNAKTTALAVPQSLHRYFKNDDVKLRAFLEKYLDAGHPARPHLAAAKLGKLAESLEVDAP
jgi:hypothetical protein